AGRRRRPRRPAPTVRRTPGPPPVRAVAGGPREGVRPGRRPAGVPAPPPSRIGPARRSPVARRIRRGCGCPAGAADPPDLVCLLWIYRDRQGTLVFHRVG